LFTLGTAMPRKPVTVEVAGEGDDRLVVLTYANGGVVKRKVDADLKPRRRPRRPPTRLNLGALRPPKGFDEA
jgi:hypothetical protein